MKRERRARATRRKDAEVAEPAAIMFPADAFGSGNRLYCRPSLEERVSMDTMKLNKIMGAILLAGVVAMTTGFVTRLIHPAYSGSHGAHHGDEQRVLAAYVKEGSAAAPPADEPAGPEPIAGLLAAADVAAGEKLFKRRCASCHSIEKGGSQKVGPALYSVVGNDIASVSGFGYSGALEELPGDWTFAALNGFLYKPKDYAQGTKMAFAGLKKTDDRAKIIAYLRAQDDTPEALPE